MTNSSEHLDKNSDENGPADENEQQLAELFSLITERMQRGEDVDIEHVCREHPEHEKELRHLWGTVMVTEAIGRDSLSAQNESTSGQVPPVFELPVDFGSYTLVEELGRGGMGVVFRARRSSSDKQVALKLMLHGDVASTTALKRFRQEAQSAQGLSHPGIVGITDVGEHDGRAFFCMELIRGETLATRLTRGPMTDREIATIISKVARAIDFAHEQGVLHRDLKPSNILIDESGEPFVVDFGLARDEQAAESLTRTGSVIGTPAYMAPEQAAGARGRVGKTSDVYSLGAILYHMLTGRPPFQASSPVDTVLMLLEQDPIAPRLLNRKVDRELEMIAMRCLQKPQDLRYQSARALADDLDAYLNDEPVSARLGRFGHVITSLMRETHHASIMENWGLLWMWHSLALLVACVMTQLMSWNGVENRWYYWLLWMAGFGAWAAVFWMLRRRKGPVTFVERQIAHLWLGSIVCIGAMFPIEGILELEPLTLSPILGLIAGMVFLVKAAILSGSFYVQALILFMAAFLMALYPKYDLLILGVVTSACFFFTGLKYHRLRKSQSN